MSRGRRSGKPRVLRGEDEAAPEASEPRVGRRSSAAREKKLSDEDLALWRRVMGSVERSDPPPVAPEASEAAKRTSAATKHAREAARRATDPDPLSPSSPAPHGRRIRLEGAPRPPIATPPQRPLVDALSPSTPGLDRRTAQRLRRGRIEPDARIDLHGMTAARAHTALIGFIHRSHANGLRCVLVITGKGGRPRNPEPGQWREPPPGEGVLKAHAPLWLAEPPLAGMVVGVYPAHVSHGGGGAYYVYLRKSAHR